VRIWAEVGLYWARSLPGRVEEVQVIHISNVLTVIDVYQVARFRCVLDVDVSSE